MSASVHRYRGCARSKAEIKMACLRIFMLCLLFLLPTAYASPTLVDNAPLATKQGSCSTDGAGSSGVCASTEEDADAKTIRTLEAYTALLEEKLQQHERQQREQQKSTFFVFLAIALSVGLVLLIALAACKVYVQSLQDQLGSVPAQQQQEAESQDETAMPRCTKYITAGAEGRQQQRLPSGTSRSSSSSSIRGSREMHRSAFFEAIDGESSDEQELRLWPSRDDVERAKAIEQARAAARPSAEVQQEQQQLESRCARLFDRLHEITDASRAFCSSSSSSESEPEATGLHGNAAASTPAPGDAAAGELAAEAAAGTQNGKKRSRRKLGSSRKKQLKANPAHLEEQQKLLQQLKELFQEIDTKFNSNKPAHVSVMIRCCNALLRADGLAVLKACADCQPLHSAAQSIIETVVPCIWAT